MDGGAGGGAYVRRVGHPAYRKENHEGTLKIPIEPLRTTTRQLLVFYARFFNTKIAKHAKARTSLFATFAAFC